MRGILLALLVPLLLGSPGFHPLPPEGALPAPQGIAKAPVCGPPLAFAENRGQCQDPVRFSAEVLGLQLQFCPDEVRVRGRGADAVVRLRFPGASRGVAPVGRDPLQTRVSYLRGSDPSRWQTGVRSYGELLYPSLYPGIDLVYHVSDGHLKYEFRVSPGANPAEVRMAYEGLMGMTMEDERELVLTVPGGLLRDTAPYAFQEGPDGDVSVPVAFRCAETAPGRWEVAFELGAYDPSLPLVIDPAIAYSSFLGGTAGEGCYDIAVDAAGSAYVIGCTYSLDFPVVAPYQGSSGGGSPDVFVAKINQAGDALVWCTYLGGDGIDFGNSIDVDLAGNVYVGGRTQSSNFPVANALQPASGGGSDGFLTVLDPSGSTLVFSTYLGGTAGDEVFAIAALPSGGVVAVGMGYDGLPLLNPIQSTWSGTEGFIARFDSSGAVVFGTYLGGTGSDQCDAVDLDAAGNVYVAGLTTSTDFPLANPLQASSGGSMDAFVTAIDAAGTALVYSTYLGGSASDDAWDIAVDANGAAVVAGGTSSPDFPVVNPFQPTKAGPPGTGDAFLIGLDPGGNAIRFSTYFGGSGNDQSSHVSLDPSGFICVSASTWSTDFPVRTPLQGASGGMQDACFAQFDPTGRILIYSSYLGGSADDYAIALTTGPNGDIYLCGGTFSPDFPLVTPFQSTLQVSEAFVTRIRSTRPEEIVVGLGSYPNPLCRAMTTTDGTSSNGFRSWLEVAYSAYAASNAETRPACGDLDGDRWAEVVVSEGTYPGNGGWIAVYDDRERGHALRRWIRVPWSAYNALDGQTWPAVGDVDGDGRAEVVAGLGPGGGGWLAVFDDEAAQNGFLRWLRVPWVPYNTANGEARPACGDVDGDGRAEVVVGLGNYSAAGGWAAVFEDASLDYRLERWVRLPWVAYNGTGGGIWPACGDVDGDGRAEVILGIGPYPASGGWAAVMEDALASYAPRTWIRTGWSAYQEANGEVRPAAGDLDGDGRAEVVLGLGTYPANGGWTLVRDDAAAGFALSRWIRVPWTAYNASNGATRPAVGELGN